MLEGLYSAAAGMAAQQTQLDAVSNDLANLSTEGYKSERVAFGDLLYNKVDVAGTETGAGAGAAARIVGHSSTQGALKETGDPLDLAIEGEGYFKVTRPDGSLALTRNGAFGVDASGQIVTAEGDRLSPPIKLPAGVAAGQVSIGSDGTVTAEGKKLGRIELVTVTSPDHLIAEGSSLLVPSKESGEPHPATGHVHQGALEDSNVDIGKDMATMMTAERAFQMQSTAIQTESQMMAIANQLRS
ncbi:MAG TPA: flagellar hook-basal body protein [Solirubrobacteraceae bacterium]|nr:flagellar hook-basal body protein [Solirubrobacteraceae bacterium]